MQEYRLENRRIEVLGMAEKVYQAERIWDFNIQEIVER